MIGRVLRVVVPLALIVVVGAGLWMAFTGSRALAAVDDLQAAADEVQVAIDDTDVPALRSAAADAQDAALRANDALDGPVWGLVAAIPYVGDTPEVARVTASALATAADGLTPLLEVSDVLDPASLYSDGRIAVDEIRAAAEPLALASADLDAAAAGIATAPTAADGAWVPASLDAQRADAADQLTEAAAALDTAAAAADVLPALLGADGPRRWFVGLQTPAEARGTGGLAGNFVVLRANDGRLSLQETGSNSDFEVLPELPDLGEEYVSRYGQDPRLFTNSNVSPNFPDAGVLWRAFYADSLQRNANVVMGTDVVAFGELIAATDSITLPDGRTLDGPAAVDFALSGVYDAYPDREERKLFQEAVATGVFEKITSGDVAADRLVAAVGAIVSEGRLQLWSPRPKEQDVLLQLPTAAALASTAGRDVHPVVINASGSKLDAYLERQMRYEVGRCPVDGLATSTVSVTLTSAIPADADLDPFVLGRAPTGPQGPNSRTQVQVHLPIDATITDVLVDDVVVPRRDFQEQGRPAMVVTVDLLPRTPLTVSVEFIEPDSDIAPTLTVQPLARAADVAIIDEPCPTG